jgi:hypothetical protein
LLERAAQRHGLSAPARRFVERAVAARKSEQSEGLVVEVEARIPILPSRSTTDTTVASAVTKCLRK